VPAEVPPTVTTETLRNGLRVISYEDAARDDVAPAAALLVPFEPAAEPVGLEGTAAVLVRLAIAGTDRDTEHGSPSARALGLGAMLTAIHDGATLGWSVTGTPAAGGPDSDPNPLLAIVLDVAITPELPGTALASDADRWRARLESDPDLATHAAQRWAAALALGFGRPVGVEPTALALGDIHREAVIRVHRRLVRPERAVVVLTGPLSPPMRARLAAWRADSMQGTPPDQPCPAPRVTGDHPPTYALRAPDEHAVVAARPVPGLGERGRAAWDAFMTRAALLPPPSGFQFALREAGGQAAAAIRWQPGAAPELAAAWQTWLSRIEASFGRAPARAAIARTPLELARRALFPSTSDGGADETPGGLAPRGHGKQVDVSPVLTALQSDAWSVTVVVADVTPPGVPTISRDRALCPTPAPE
jgi:hypothetical protein